MNPLFVVAWICATLVLVQIVLAVWLHHSPADETADFAEWEWELDHADG